MYIIYDSRANSGTTKHFAKQLGKLFDVPVMSVIDVSPYAELPPFILCTYTIDYGAVPTETEAFLKHHSQQMLAVVANGSSNFRTMGLFGRAGDRIADKYDVELLGRLDMGGTREDLKHIAERIAVISAQPMKITTIEQVRPQSTFINGRFSLQPM